MATKKYVSLEKLGLYDEKIKKVISDGDAASLDAAKGYADSLAENYEPSGAIATAKTEIQGKIDAVEVKADAAAQAASVAQGEVDALEILVGTLPAGTDATTVVDYVTKRTEGIATDAALGELQNAVDLVEADVATIKEDYLKSSDKTELSDDITAEKSRAEGIESGLRSDVDVIKGDYLKTSDKTTLQSGIDANAGAIAAVKEDVDAFFADADMTEAAKDTLKELQEYIASDETGAAAMSASIKANSDAIGVLEGAVATKAEAQALTDAVAALESADGNLDTRLQAVEAKFNEGEGSVEDMIADAVGAEATRVDGLLANKVDKVEGKGLSTNDLTNELKANYDAAYDHSQVAHAPANAQANIIESVKVNGTAVTITDKAVDITVPTDNVQLANGAGYLVANDIANKADKGTTLAAYGIADAYTSAQTDSAIATAIGQFEECSEAEINALFA